MERMVLQDQAGLEGMKWLGYWDGQRRAEMQQVHRNRGKWLWCSFVWLEVSLLLRNMRWVSGHFNRIECALRSSLNCMPCKQPISFLQAWDAAQASCPQEQLSSKQWSISWSEKVGSCHCQNPGIIWSSSCFKDWFALTISKCSYPKEDHEIMRKRCA